MSWIDAGRPLSLARQLSAECIRLAPLLGEPALQLRIPLFQCREARGFVYVDLNRSRCEVGRIL